MADQEEPVVNNNPAVAANGNAAAAQAAREVKLPSFWPSRPAAWFRLAESRFRLRNITEELVMFDHLLSALPEDVISSVLDILEEVGEEEPYSILKERLLETHVLSDFEKMEMLFKVPALGARKPSQLLTAMLEVCPTNEEKTKLFIFLFMQRLPKDLRLMLGDVEAGDPRAVAAKADRLWACHAKQNTEATVAAVAEDGGADDDEAVLAAIKGGKPGQQSKGQWRKKKFGGGNNYKKQGKAPQQQQDKSAPMDIAIAASGLCRAHWFNGEKAKQCSPNSSSCSWQEN